MYTVTRQLQWPDGTPVVEVSSGGIDYTNPDALVAKYDGEFEEFADPREAVKTAIEICRQWRKDGETKAVVGHGATLGCTMPFDETTFEEATTWAQKQWEGLDKCPQCQTIMEENDTWWEAGWWSKDDFEPYGDGIKYCSQNCAEQNSEVDEEGEDEEDCDAG